MNLQRWPTWKNVFHAKQFFTIFWGSIFISLFPCTAEAQDVNGVAHAVSSNHIKVSGYIDGSYNYLARSHYFTSYFYDRFLDLETNGFTFQEASLRVSKNPPQGAGFLLRMIVGRDAYRISVYGMNPNVFDIQNVGFAVEDAYLQYALHDFTFLAGIMEALANGEAYDLANNSNFSFSLLNTFATPGIVMGGRVVYTVSPTLDLSLGINNGWDTIQDTGRQKTLELGISYQITPAVFFEAQEYYGEQPVTDGASGGPTGMRNLIDVEFILHLTEKLDLILNYDYAFQTTAALPNAVMGRAVWQGIVGYLNYSCNDRWKLSLRGEIFSDTDGYLTGVRQSIKEGTFTISYLPAKAFEFRAETRRDISNVSSFLSISRHGTSRYQQSFALEGLYKF